MKILLLSTSSSRNAGGLYNSVRNLGQELTRKGAVETAVMAFHDEKSDEDNKAYDPLELIEYTIKGPSGIAFTTDLYEKMKAYKPNLVHIQGIWLYTSHINSKYCSKNHIPYIISPRGMLDPWILNTRSWKKKLGLFLYEQKHIQNAACLHALGLPEYNALRAFGYKKPIAIVPNGVYVPNDISIPADYELPEWKKNTDKKVMLFLSRVHSKKGLDNLLESWGKIGNQNWKLVIAGEPHTEDYLNKLKEIVNRNKIHEEVEFIGATFHKDKDIAFRSADAFILPSFSEGMPMAVLEAWSYALPVIMTDECNISEGFDKGAAFRVETDVDSLTKSLVDFMSLSQQKLSVMGENGRELVREKYSWSSIEEEMVKVYDWCLDNKKPLPASVKLD